MSDENVIRILRAQAWERAKGELNAVLQTYISGTQSTQDGHFEKMDKLVADFISTVEGDGLAE